MKYFAIYMIVCTLLYIVPSGIGAFVSLDWAYLDFTTWKTDSRASYAVVWAMWTFLFSCFIIGEENL